MPEFVPDPPAIQEIKLFHPLRTTLELARKAFELLGLKDPPAYTSDHYKPENWEMDLSSVDSDYPEQMRFHSVIEDTEIGRKT